MSGPFSAQDFQVKTKDLVQNYAGEATICPVQDASETKAKGYGTETRPVQLLPLW